MEEINLQNKDNSISNIYNQILGLFGKNFFEYYVIDGKKYLIDFWEDDLSAMGLKKGEKVVYISTWDFRENPESNMNYYMEFEIIDNNTLETKQTINIIKEAEAHELLSELTAFFEFQGYSN